MSAVLSVKIIGDSRSARKSFSDTSKAAGRTQSKLEQFNKAMDKAVIPAAAVGAGLLAMGKQAIDSASQLQQATGAVEAVYGAQADAVKKLAADAANNVGLAASEYSQMSALIGAQLTNLGMPMSQVANQSDQLIRIGADLAAQFGGSTSDAVSALSSLLRGERDPIERYSISINQAAIEAKKAELGLTGLTGAADQNATMQATLALVNEKAAVAQGAYAREADTAEGAQSRANAQIENAKAALGTAFLPIVAAAAQQLQKFGQWAQNNTTTVQALAGVIGVLAGAVLAWKAIQAASTVVTGIATAAQIAWNVAMSANPIGLIVIAVAALIGVIALLIANWDKVKAVALACWEAIKSAVSAAASWISSVASSIAAWFSSAWANVSAVFNGLVASISAGVSRIVGFFSGIPAAIRGAFAAAIDWAASKINSLRNIVSNAVSGIIGWFQAIPDKIRAAFSIQPPEWLKKAASFIGFSQPAAAPLMLAQPALTTFAEPLALPAASIFYPTRRATVASAAPSITVNINGGMINRETVDELLDKLEQAFRRSGRLALAGGIV